MRGEKIDWDKPDPYYVTLNAIFYRSIKPENKKILTEACEKTIDFLRKTLNLKKWEAYVVVRTLYKEFPMKELIEEHEELDNK